jgi:hypothetical protein
VREVHVQDRPEAQPGEARGGYPRQGLGVLLRPVRLQGHRQEQPRQARRDRPPEDHVFERGHTIGK